MRAVVIILTIMGDLLDVAGHPHVFRSRRLREQ
jgi:hypothetical protein